MQHMLVGCGIISVMTERHSHEGPLAVRPDLQGKGVGSHLLEYAESNYGMVNVDVVSCRTDLEKFYNKRGYK